ncbi:Fungal lipase-like domain [Arabidopsis thaliana x Arabidopsis arenosa]|uniref:Fungal lipase-like domain n=1 Tax=Arabidopsis thaliana x Arabidopsis arenosa TaxID=1240361 RepID=A0A8T1ZPG1_9BRAS|nr:Fungal lipase-like domain [Arabidopsis thaliana x Arabidopsis arenosa]
MAFEALAGISGDLITTSWIASKKAYQTERYHKEEAGTVVIFAFRPSFTAEDLFAPANISSFGEIKMNRVQFPCMRKIGKGDEATVNEVFLRNLEVIIDPRTSFYASVEMAISSRKQIVFTGHSSGGATAILATVWYLEKYFIRNPNVYPEPRCVTFGAPLVGDSIFSHALGRENWSRFFVNFVTRFDIVPRIMLARKASIEQTLPHVLGQLDPRNPSIQESDQRITEFYTTVMRDTSTVANRAFCELTGSAEAFLETLSSFLELSPYRPAGTFVFSTDNRLVAVNNSDAILQMLFYTSQARDEQEWSLIPFLSIRDHHSYGELVQSMGMKLFNHLDLHQCLLDGQNSIGSWLNELGVSTRGRQYVLAALEEEKKRVENQKKIENKWPQIVKELSWIENEYKPKCQAHKNGYYDSFKVSNEENDFKANVKRAQLAGIFDEVLGLSKKGQLPDEFEGGRDWVELATRYRRLIEPLDIANYHRHLKNEDTGPYMIRGRPNRYIYAQRGYEHLILKPEGRIAEDVFWNKVNGLNLGLQQEIQEILKNSGSECGSCFWAEVEELKGKPYEEVEVRVKTLEGLLGGWITAGEVDDKEIFLEGSTFRKWWITLPLNHKLHSPLREHMMDEIRAT